MAHILILKASQDSEFADEMFRSVTDIITANGHSYDEIIVPTVKDMPFCISAFAESLNYEASICIGIMINNEFEQTKLHYQEVTRSLYDYSTYFVHLIGNCITFHESDSIINKDVLSAHAKQVAISLCELMQKVRELNSMDSTNYGGRLKHN